MGLGKLVRNKRYSFQKNSDIKFVIETGTGSRLFLEPVNCSLMGIGATISPESLKDNLVEVEEIVPTSKISWEGHEYALGRLVIQSMNQTTDGKVVIGFSLIDSKMPIDGPLGRFLETGVGDINPYEVEMNADNFSIATFSKAHHDSLDLFTKCFQYSSFFKEWRESSRFLYDTVRKESFGNRVKLTKKRANGRDDYIVMGSNDYLGLASHPKVCEAATEAIKGYGFGSTGSPLTTGTTDIHEELKHLLARTFKKDGALLFNSGYAANAGAIPAILSDQDLVVADILSHVSLQDGISMSKATSRFFKHNSMEHLEKVLADKRDEHAGALLITEGVFSMDGDVPDLRSFVQLAKKYKARTFVDEAHSLGVVGERGLGACHKFDVLKDVDIVMGTFSKICGGIGGFIVASEEVIDWYFWLARAHVFTVSIPPSTAAAMLASLNVFLSQPELVENLQKNIKHFVGGMRHLGANLNPDHESAVVPVVIGDEKKIEIISAELMEAGVHVIPIVYPAVSRKGARFRFTVMASHTVSDLDYVLNVFESAMKKADFRFEEVENLFVDKESLQRAS